MFFGNPRQAIHDAYAINSTTPDPVSMGSGTAFDSNRRQFMNMKAGLVISVVSKLKPHLKGIALYCFAPDGVCTETEANRILTRLWVDFMKTNNGIKTIPLATQGELIVLARKVLQNFRVAIHDGLQIHTRADMAKLVGRLTVESFTESLEPYCKSMENILNGYVGKALAPVAEIVMEQRNTIKDNRREELFQRINDEELSEYQCLEYLNKQCGGYRPSLGSISVYEADVLENYLDVRLEIREIKLLEREEAADKASLLPTWATG